MLALVLSVLRSSSVTWKRTGEWACTCITNPSALHDIQLDFFGGIDSQYWIENGEIDGEVREFSPIYSVTHFFEAKPGESSIACRDDELRTRAKQEALTIEEAIRRDPEYLAWHDSRLE
jgi:hypothetical protein